ncbi:MAG TPA: SpoIID/LytB domain-containing protein, partial [bacterium]|nr:SpoIID/LytB domain-containing protein [bacterium]
MKIQYFLLFLIVGLAGCATEPIVLNPGATPVPTSEVRSIPGRKIRVAIALHQASVHLVAPESFTVSGFPFETPGVQEGAKSYRETTLTFDRLYSKKARIEPSGEGEIQVNGKSFKGSMEIISEPGGTLTVINELPLEDYIMGVLAGEIPRDWPLEALKAQAIAARTFAVFKRATAREKDEPYDLESSAQFQMYQGSGLVNEKIQQAVSETQGRIMTYGSEPIMAFFHSNCGGETCGAMDVWHQDKPYLKPVHCPFGNNGIHYRWHAEIPIRDLVRQLRTAGIKVGDIVRLEILERDASNRILRLSIMDADGSRKTFRGAAFRMAVGPDVIRSTRFTAEIGPEMVVFNGRGWGHG